MNEDPRAALGQRLRVEAARRGWSGAEVARRAGIAQSAWARYASGDSEPGATKLAAIADALDVSVDYLLGRDPSPYRSGLPIGAIILDVHLANRILATNDPAELRSMVRNSAPLYLLTVRIPDGAELTDSEVRAIELRTSVDEHLRKHAPALAADERKLEHRLAKIRSRKR